MTIRQHLAILQGRHRSVDGVEWAPDEYPKTIEIVPTMLAVPGPAVHYTKTMGRGELYTDRQYVAHLYHDILQRDLQGDNMDGTYGLIENVINKYYEAAYRGLPGVTGNYPDLMVDAEENNMEDEGLYPVTYFSGQKFLGTTFTVVIRDVRDPSGGRDP